MNTTKTNEWNIVFDLADVILLFGALLCLPAYAYYHVTNAPLYFVMCMSFYALAAVLRQQIQAASYRETVIPVLMGLWGVFLVIHSVLVFSIIGVYPLSENTDVQLAFSQVLMFIHLACGMGMIYGQRVYGRLKVRGVLYLTFAILIQVGIIFTGALVFSGSIYLGILFVELIILLIKKNMYS